MSLFRRARLRAVRLPASGPALRRPAAVDVPSGPAEQAGTGTALLEREELSVARPWQVVVWNDPVNLMSYVAYVFRSYFGFSHATAQQLMLQVHEEGRAVVASGAKEEAERHVQAMHGYGLWATLQQETP